jgi:hypothetical protein
VFKFAAVLVITPLVLAGCSSSGGGNSTSPPASTPASSPPASTPAASETVTAAQAKATLLTVQDVGPGFTAAPFRPSHDPLPCKPNDPPLEEQFPSTLEVGAAFLRNGNGAALGEDLSYYADASTAHEVLTLAAAGLNCPSGKLNFTGKPVTVQFGNLQDVTSSVGADYAIAIQATAPTYDIVLIGCQVGREDVLFSFLRTKSTPTSSLPNPITIVQTAVQKIKNA